MRYVATLEYAGNSYHGWQKQQLDNIETIQTHIEHSFSKVANHPVEVICAGRTDSGVHASSQVIHFDSDAQRTEHAWVCGVNGLLPRDIVVHSVKPIDDDFHARFSATARRYHYWIYNHQVRPGILQNKLTWHLPELAADLMHEAAQYLLGEHDFSSFRASHCQANTPIRTMHEITVQRIGKLIKLDLYANAFLHHMVRNIVGSLLLIGEQKKPVDWLQQVLQAKDRTQAAATASPDGLYLVYIDYPEYYQILQPQPICYTIN